MGFFTLHLTYTLSVFCIFSHLSLRERTQEPHACIQMLTFVWNKWICALLNFGKYLIKHWICCVATGYEKKNIKKRFDFYRFVSTHNFSFGRPPVCNFWGVRLRSRGRGCWLRGQPQAKINKALCQQWFRVSGRFNYRFPKSAEVSAELPRK